ncbi:MAG: hypothetical protein GC199_03715 [Alphaproteobacteria bacterium]|nr:hypothetical protein [Alphaproteobacteria bacterium]
MIQALNLATLALTIALCFGLYKITNETRQAQRDLNAIEQKIEAERETIDVLRAEWSHLVRPARLEALSERHLALQSVSATQISTLDRIPFRADLPSALPPLRGVPAPAFVPRRKPSLGGVSF